MDNKHILMKKTYPHIINQKPLKFLGLSLFSQLQATFTFQSQNIIISQWSTSTRCLFRLHSKDLKWSPRWWRNPQVKTFPWWLWWWSWWSWWWPRYFNSMSVWWQRSCPCVEDEVKWYISPYRGLHGGSVEHSSPWELAHLLGRVWSRKQIPPNTRT